MDQITCHTIQAQPIRKGPNPHFSQFTFLPHLFRHFHFKAHFGEGYGKVSFIGQWKRFDLELKVTHQVWYGIDGMNLVVSSKTQLTQGVRSCMALDIDILAR